MTMILAVVLASIPPLTAAPPKMPEPSRTAAIASDAPLDRAKQVLVKQLDEMDEAIDPFIRHALNRSFMSNAPQIGVTLSSPPNLGIIITGVYAGGPAEVAGIRPQDRLLAVDGQDTGNVTLSEAYALLSGPGRTRIEVSRRGRLLKFRVLRLSLPCMDRVNASVDTKAVLKHFAGLRKISMGLREKLAATDDPLTVLKIGQANVQLGQAIAQAANLLLGRIQMTADMECRAKFGE